MKNYFYMAVAAIVALSSCSNDNDIIGGTNETTGNASVFTATIENSDTRTSIADGSDANHKKVNWSNGDKITINGKEYSTTSTSETAEFTAVDGDASPVTIATKQVYIASYPSNIVLSVGSINSIPTITGTFPASQNYDIASNGISNIPMAAVSTTTNLSFKNVCALLAITVPSTEMSKVKRIVISTDKQINGSCFVGFENASTFEGPYLAFSSPNPTEAEKQITLNCGDSGVNIVSGQSKTFYVAIPAGTYSPLTIKVSNGTTSKVMETKKTGGVSIERNKIYSINFENNVPNLLAGDFSVSETKMVKFTRSNLWCNTTVNPVTFDFEENQYDYPTSWGTGELAGSHIGHFLWCKTAANSYAVNYDDGTNTETDKFWLDGSDDNHMITVAGTSNLYVLSSAEWIYLMNKNNEQTGARNQTNRYAKAKINGKKGILVFPDGYSEGTKVSGTGIATVNISYVDFPTEDIPAVTWVSMEEDGVVFLPEAGSRLGTEVGDGNYHGVYWTSSPYDGNSARHAYSLDFAKTYVLPAFQNARENSQSLRLVK